MALLIGPVVAMLGVFAAFIVLRTRAQSRQSLYSARRTMLEARAQERRERALAPKPPSGTAPTPVSAPQPPASPPALPAWDTSPLPRVLAAEAPPVAPAAPPRWEPQPNPAAAAVPVPAFLSAASVEPPPLEIPPPAESTSPEPEPEPEPPSAAPAEPAVETSAPAEAWSIVEPQAKESTPDRTPPGHLDEKQQSWDVVPHQRHAHDGDGLLAQPVLYTKRQSTAQNLLSYVVLVGALVVVLLGVLLMLATSH